MNEIDRLLWLHRQSMIHFIAASSAEYFGKYSAGAHRKLWFDGKLEKRDYHKKRYVWAILCVDRVRKRLISREEASRPR
jgi:hypothetical protein